MDVIKKIVSSSQTLFWFTCPGCGEEHAFDDRWTFNLDYEKPTIGPSLLVHWGPDGVNRCHSFIKDGMIEFLGDCTHEHAGETMQIPPLPEWLLNSE